MNENTLEVTERLEVFEFARINDLVNQTLQKNFGQHLDSDSLSTGFRAFDQATGGFKKGQLISIAVKPGMGKTAFLLSLANNMAIKNDYSVAILSAERSNEKMTNRLIESETGMSLERLRKGALKPSEKDHMYSLINSIARARIFLDDSPSISSDELVMKIRQLKNNHNVDLVIIDYLELLSPSIAGFDSRNEQYSIIVRIMRDVAHELNLPVVLFSQTPATFPSFRQSRRPGLSDLPLYLAELSDMVVFLHRSGFTQSNGGSSGKSQVELVVVKHPDSSRPTVVNIEFIESIAKFVDFS